MFGKDNWFKSLYAGLVLFLSSGAGFSVLPGTIVSDDQNYWGHNGKLANAGSKAAYILCDGYIASPLIANETESVQSFINNCQTTPPPGSLPIIDAAENHSVNYPGYPAYAVKPLGADHVYFVCDGFLNSSAWCSYAAHNKAQKLLRAAESRFWEAGSKALIIDDRPVNYTARLAPNPPEKPTIAFIKPQTLPEPSRDEPRPITRNFIDKLPNADDQTKVKRVIVISEDLKSFIEQTVTKTLNKRKN